MLSCVLLATGHLCYDATGLWEVRPTGPASPWFCGSFGILFVWLNGLSFAFEVHISLSFTLSIMRAQKMLTCISGSLQWMWPLTFVTTLLVSQALPKPTNITEHDGGCGFPESGQDFTVSNAAQNDFLVALYGGLWMLTIGSYICVAVISCRSASVRVQCSVWARVLSYLASFTLTTVPFWLYLHFEVFMIQHPALRIGALTLVRLNGFCTACVYLVASWHSQNFDNKCRQAKLAKDAPALAPFRLRFAGDPPEVHEVSADTREANYYAEQGINQLHSVLHDEHDPVAKGLDTNDDGTVFDDQFCSDVLIMWIGR
jgi:hypothetical protein